MKPRRDVEPFKVKGYLLWAEALAFETGSGSGPGKKRELSALVGCA